MSMHDMELTELERSGLEAHHLKTGTPSQLSDSFRLGVAWALNNSVLVNEQEHEELKAYCQRLDDLNSCSRELLRGASHIATEAGHSKSSEQFEWHINHIWNAMIEKPKQLRTQSTEVNNDDG